VDNLQLQREKLDRLDDEIVSLLGTRLRICRDIAAHKKKSRIPMMQEGRVAEVKRRVVARGKAEGLSEEFLSSLYEMIIAEACRIEDSIIDEPRSSG